jgi:hypothetical protein
MGFRLGPARRGAGGSMRWAAVLCAIVAAAAAGLLALKVIVGGPGGDSGVDLQIDPRPVITSLQQIGQLHTVKMTMKDVLAKSTDRPAEGWLHAVPGGDALSRWATRNEALVVAEGSVEAGIDLSSISQSDVSTVRLPDGSTQLRVHLPAPVVYPPNVVLRVQKTESGLMWKDENLIPKAQEEASRRFLDAAEKDRIRDVARENALIHLRKIERALGHTNVDFYF